MWLCYIYVYMKHTLEQSSTFPYIAWAFIVAFGIMTVTLSLELNKEMTALASDREDTTNMIRSIPR